MRKTICKPNYTFVKRDIFYFSRRIPEDLQQHYPTTRITQSLRTKKTREAATAARLLSSQLDQQWFQLRLQKQAGQLSGQSFLSQNSTQLTLEEALTYYLKHKGKSRSKLFHEHASRHVSYLQQAVIEKKQLKDFTAKDALTFRDWLQHKGLRNASVHKAFSSIRAIFTFAIQEHALGIKNVFTGVYLPSEKEDAKKRLPIAIDDIRHIQSQCKIMDDDLRWLVALISDTGMRLAEAAGLTLSDIHLDEDIPYITVQPHPHRSLKTPSSERVIPLTGASLWAAKRIEQNATSDYCFPRYTNNERCNSNSASAALNKWVKATTNKAYVIHGFRHSFRDRLRSLGAQSELIDQLGGWSLKSVGQGYGDGYGLCNLFRFIKDI